MASLVLGLAGAAVGGYFFPGGMGARVGWMVGVAAGKYLFAPEPATMEGPRLNDLSVQSATRGAAIPTVYGADRIAGNMIWTEGIKETKHVQSSDGGGKGGGGGGGSTQVSYTYSASFAIGFCEGPIVGVRRIWADTDLIYDKGLSSSADTLTASNAKGVQVYSGDNSQLPDPAIEASVGVGSTPAYRGLCYLVFNTLQLEKYGNRIPNITAEIVAEGAVDLSGDILHTTGNLTSGPTEYWWHIPVQMDSDGKTWFVEFYHWSNGGWSYNTNDVLLYTVDAAGVRVDYDDISNLYWQTVPISSNTPRAYIMTCLPGNALRVVGTTNHWTAPTRRIRLVKVFEAEIMGTYDVPSDAYEPRFGWVTAPSSDLHYLFSPDNGVTGNIRIYRGEQMSTTPGKIIDVTFSTKGYSFTYGLDGCIYLLDFGVDGSPGSTTADLYKYSGTGVLLTSYTITFPDLVVQSMGSGSEQAFPAVDENGLLYVLTTEPRSYFIDGTEALDIGNVVQNTYDSRGRLFANSNYLGTGGASTNNSTTWQHTKVAQTINADEIDVADIIEDLGVKAGLETTDIDVSGVADSVTGYTRTARMASRGAMLPLLEAFQIAAIESDDKLKFFNCDGGADESLGDSDLAAHTGDSVPDLVSLTRMPDLELPRRVKIVYTEQGRDYQQGVQMAQRILT